jgi:hypothetical protein
MRLSRKLWLWIGFIAVILVFLVGGFVRLLLPFKVWKVILFPDRVESYRINPEGKSDQNSLFAPYAILQKGPELTKPQIEALDQIILTQIVHSPLPQISGSRKMCLFEPGIGLRFLKGGKEVQMLICFHCDQWTFTGKQGAGDFDHVRPSILRIARGLFPTEADFVSDR